MSTIPASNLVQVIPNVLSAGGTTLDLNGVLLTDSVRAPIGQVLQFPSSDGVADFFGATSAEASFAINYFLGWDNSTQKPGRIYFSQFPTSAVAAWLRGASIKSLALTALQAIAGTLIVTVDGSVRTASALNLSSVTSFSAAAAAIQTALNAGKAQTAAFTGAISGTTLTVSAVASGALAIGQIVSGSGVTAGTKITALLTGSGGIGTYTVSVSQTAASTSMTTVGADVAVAYDTISGGLQITSGVTGATSSIAYATGTTAGVLGLDVASGGLLSQGAVSGATQTPAAFMNALVDITQNWATFSTTFDPDAGSGVTLKLAFAAWTNSKNNRYAYIPWDADASARTIVPASSSLGQQIIANAYSGIAVLHRATADLAAFVMGMAASIDTNAINGRITFAHKGQEGLVASITNETDAANLESNGYNFYGAYATASQQFRLFYPGSVSGKFQWLDSYINQIWLNANLQQALMVLISTANSLPYNDEGYSLIEAACLDPILRAKKFGAIREGITLSKQQAAMINSAAGRNIADIVTTQGWYLQILDAAPITRQARKSPPCNFWYADGQSIHTIKLNSVEVM